MFSRILTLRRFLRFDKRSKHCPIPGNIFRNFAVTSIARSKSMKVAVLGAAGRTGSCLSLLLKQSSLIDELAIYDKIEISSLALELGHIDTTCRVSSYSNGEDALRDVLEDTKVVVIAAGNPCHGKYFSNDSLRANADILLDCIPNVIKYCPRALIALVTSPMNSLVPLIVEIYKKHGIYDHNGIFGITTLNCIRANTFVAEIIRAEPECVMVPVICGNCSKTRVPIFSQMKPTCKLSHEEISKLTYAVTMAEDEITEVNNDKENSSLSMGYAAARFCISLCKALRDQRGVVECAYTRSCLIPEVTYFAGPLELGPCGIQKHLGLPPLTDQECKIFGSALSHLKDAIKLGEALALGPGVTSTETCPQHPDICSQEISGKMAKSNELHQVCPT